MLYSILHWDLTSLMQCFIIDPAMRCAALRTPNVLASGWAVIYVCCSVTGEPDYTVALLNYVNVLLID